MLGDQKLGPCADQDIFCPRPRSLAHAQRHSSSRSQTKSNSPVNPPTDGRELSRRLEESRFRLNIMAQVTTNGVPAAASDTSATLSTWAQKYRGATVEDLDLPPALSTSPTTSLSDAMTSALSHDYSHLTVLSDSTRSLLGYLPISKLRTLLETGQLRPGDPVSKAMVKFNRRRAEGKEYKVITMDTELWELEGFFEGIGPASSGSRQDFAVVTDAGRKFVLGVATRGDLDEFVKRRPA